MRDNLKKITIKGASGWGPVDLAYDDKLTQKQVNLLPFQII